MGRFGHRQETAAPRVRRQVVEEAPHRVEIRGRRGPQAGGRSIAKQQPRGCRRIHCGGASSYGHPSRLLLRRGHGLQRVGQHEFVFRASHREHRARRDSHHALRHAAHQQVPQHAAAVRAHHDEIDVGLFGVVGDDERGRRRGVDHRGHRRRLAVVRAQEIRKSPARVFFHALLHQGEVVRRAVDAGREHRNFHDVKHVQPCAEVERQRAPIFQRESGRLAEVSGDQNVLDLDHDESSAVCKSTGRASRLGATVALSGRFRAEEFAGLRKFSTHGWAPLRDAGFKEVVVLSRANVRPLDACCRLALFLALVLMPPAALIVWLLMQVPEFQHLRASGSDHSIGPRAGIPGNQGRTIPRAAPGRHHGRFSVDMAVLRVYPIRAPGTRLVQGARAGVRRPFGRTLFMALLRTRRVHHNQEDAHWHQAARQSLARRRHQGRDAA